MNQAVLVGVVLSSELREAGSTPLLKIRMKTGTRVVREDGPKVFWDYHNIAFWGRAARDTFSLAPKGATISVVGRIATRTYEKNGEKRYATEINASSVGPVVMEDMNGANEGEDQEA
jgi:single-strand DNA-binding protein